MGMGGDCGGGRGLTRDHTPEEGSEGGAMIHWSNGSACRLHEDKMTHCNNWHSNLFEPRCSTHTDSHLDYFRFENTMPEK